MGEAGGSVFFFLLAFRPRLPCPVAGPGPGSPRPPWRPAAHAGQQIGGRPTKWGWRPCQSNRAPGGAGAGGGTTGGCAWVPPSPKQAQMGGRPGPPPARLPGGPVRASPSHPGAGDQCPRGLMQAPGGTWLTPGRRCRGGRREQQSAGGERGETASQLLSPAPPSRGGRGGVACTTRRPGAVEGRVIDRPGVVRRRSGVARSASGPDGDWGGRKRMGSPPPLLCCVCAGLAPRARRARPPRARPPIFSENQRQPCTYSGRRRRPRRRCSGSQPFFLAVREKKREGG